MIRSKTMALILTVSLAISALNPLYAFGASKKDTAKIEGEYVPGEALICIDPDRADIEKTASGSGGLFSDGGDITSSFCIDVSDAISDLNREEKASLSCEPGDKAVIELVRSDTLSTEELIDLYSGKEGVLYAEPNYIRRQEQPLDTGITRAAPKDTDKPDLTRFQYYLKDGERGIDVPDWNNRENKNARGTVVAVIDSGVDYTNEDLKGVMWDEGLNYPELTKLGGGKYGIFTAADNYEGDFPRGSDDPLDTTYSGHGTHCAGIIAAEWNGYGISGVANGAKIMAIGVSYDDYGHMDDADILEGINYVIKAKDAGVNVTAINFSLGGIEISYSFKLCIREVCAKEIIFLKAAGNEWSNVDICNIDSSFLYDIPGEINVGATDQCGDMSVYSNYGIRSTHILAPGDEILSTVPLKAGGAVPDPEYSSPAKDVEGNLLYDDLSSPSPFTYTKNSGNEGAMDLSGGFIKLTDIRRGEEDPLTDEVVRRETYATVAFTMSANKALKEHTDGGRYSLILKARTFQKDVWLCIYQKNKDGEWDLIFDDARNVPWDEAQYLVFPFTNEEKADLENFEIGVVVFSPSDDHISEADIDDIWITDKVYPYGFMSGTSMATPVVAGMAAVMAGNFPNDSAAKRAARILAGVESHDKLKDFSITGGIANLKNSLDEKSYTPVINSIKVGREGLSIDGYFFGNKEDTEVEITQGDKTWTSKDGSFSVIDVKKGSDNDEILTGIPSGLERDVEVKVSVINRAGKEGRQRFERYLIPSDPEGVLKEGNVYSRIPIPDGFKKALSDLTVLELFSIKNKLVFKTFSEERKDFFLFSFDPDTGSFEKMGDIDRGGRMTAYKGMILNMEGGDEGSQLVCYEGPEKIKTLSLKIGEKDTAEEKSWVFDEIDGYDHLELYNDGQELLVFRSRYGEAGEGEEDPVYGTVVYTLDPDKGIISYLGSLKAFYYYSDFVCSGIIISHEERSGEPNNIYIAGMSRDEKGEELFRMEKFTAKKGFTSEFVEIPEPERLVPGEIGNTTMQDLSFISGCGVKDGIFLTGPHEKVEESGGKASVSADNYFFSYAHPEEGFKPCDKRISGSNVYFSIAAAGYGKVYFWGMGPDDFVFCYTDSDTLPHYGDTDIPEKKADGSWEYTREQNAALSKSQRPAVKIPLDGEETVPEMSLYAAKAVRFTKTKSELYDSILDKETSLVRVKDREIKVKKVVVKNPKKAFVSENSIFRNTISEFNLSKYDAFKNKKKPAWYPVFDTKNLPGDVKRIVKKLNKKMKKEPIPIDILPITFTGGNLKVDKFNKNKGQVKKLLYTDEKEKKTKLKASSAGKKDYKQEKEGDLIKITGTNNYDGEVRYNPETGDMKPVV